MGFGQKIRPNKGFYHWTSKIILQYNFKKSQIQERKF